MKMIHQQLTFERASELLSYDPITGGLQWRVSRGSNCIKGQKAGRISDVGCLQVQLDGVRYRAHRVIHLLMTGEWPLRRIQHIDGDYLSNKWGNLKQNETGRQYLHLSG